MTIELLELIKLELIAAQEKEKKAWNEYQKQKAKEIEPILPSDLLKEAWLDSSALVNSLTSVLKTNEVEV